jgi:hypothetical protein
MDHDKYFGHRDTPLIPLERYEACNSFSVALKYPSGFVMRTHTCVARRPKIESGVTWGLKPTRMLSFSMLLLLAVAGSIAPTLHEQQARNMHISADEHRGVK